MTTKICLAAGLSALLAFSGGCGSSSSVITVEPHPTIIEVSPQEFLGSLSCGTGADQVQRYVATLTDVTRVGDPAAPIEFELPSSAPARCQQGVAFGLVVSGHFYVARIDAYDRSDLEPLDAGSAILRDPSTLKPVAPRWSTDCGTSCPYAEGKGCPKLQTGQDPMVDPYIYAVRAESELTQPMNPCWAWPNP